MSDIYKRKIAALIIAHNDEVHLCRLANALHFSPSIDIYIHVDKKWNVDIEELREKLWFCRILERRISGQLDNWSLVEIALSLINTALANDRYMYYMLLSGSDYLMMDALSICSFLERQYPSNYIDVTPHSKNNWINRKFSKWYFYRLDSFILDLEIPHSCKYLFRKIRRTFEEVYSFIYSPYKGLKKMNVQLYGGSTWWILSDYAIECILDYAQHNSQMINYIKHSTTPDETFFQTMYMNANVDKNPIINSPSERLQNCKTYAYFTDSYEIKAKKPFMGHPYVFSMEERDLINSLIENKKHFFARKFSTGISADILDYIDQALSITR